MAHRILRDYPEDFTIHQNADDGVVVVFLEANLDRFADRLKLRRIRRMSEGQKQRAVERLRGFRYTPHVRRGKASQNRGTPAKVDSDP